ncbi:hypothetical protein IMG5_156030 [Ichthyophthirius multifiliis]|uniref:Uncharacterized protein n=1 Tax=Ichthyophthirius multifiliis TaxID=5932 RepID=G0QZE1_ICHMU|nr:hypothetical protein IMG5_156030 [Ichthyophthirius multifiliis]EGR29410.1 hypothetical protein IMG5_156030 [Ichthyophthirius multifiliis]|eukprot:XP_004030646.1 hypothetical protein IMG5_156030 [Ichthyophthirius multifiliis]
MYCQQWLYFIRIQVIERHFSHLNVLLLKISPKKQGSSKLYSKIGSLKKRITDFERQMLSYSIPFFWRISADFVYLKSYSQGEIIVFQYNNFICNYSFSLEGN